MKLATGLRIIRTVLFAALLVVFAVSIPAQAAEQVGSLTLRCTVKKEGTTIPLSGDTYALVRIADAQVSVSGGTVGVVYTVRPAYKAFDCDWVSLPTSQLRKVISDLASEARKHPGDWTTGVTDSEGTVRFGALYPGLYLVMRTEVASQNSRYVSEPFLTSVPEVVDNAVSYDVVSTPKFGWEEDPAPTTPPSKPPSPGLAQTGQLWWPVPMLVMTGLELIAIDLYRDRKKSGRLSRDA